MMHMMIDTETWGLAANSAIRSIGIVVFCPMDEPGRVVEEFYTAVDDKTGAKLDSTVEWWSKQSAEAQSVFENPEILPLALRNVTEIFYRNRCSCVWAHGSVFDVPLMENAYSRCWVSHPWNYKNVRDTRTIYELAGETIVSLPGYETKHHALHDAYNQAVMQSGGR